MAVNFETREYRQMKFRKTVSNKNYITQSGAFKKLIHKTDET